MTMNDMWSIEEYCALQQQQQLQQLEQQLQQKQQGGSVLWKSNVPLLEASSQAFLDRLNLPSIHPFCQLDRTNYIHVGGIISIGHQNSDSSNNSCSNVNMTLSS